MVDSLICNLFLLDFKKQYTGRLKDGSPTITKRKYAHDAFEAYYDVCDYGKAEDDYLKLEKTSHTLVNMQKNEVKNLGELMEQKDAQVNISRVKIECHGQYAQESKSNNKIEKKSSKKKSDSALIHKEAKFKYAYHFKQVWRLSSRRILHGKIYHLSKISLKELLLIWGIAFPGRIKAKLMKTQYKLIA